MVGRHVTTTRQHRRGVEEPAVAIAVHKPHQRHQTLGESRQASQRLEVCLHKGRLEQQILRRIAGDGQFRHHHQVSPPGLGVHDRLGDPATVRLQISHSQIELRQGHTQRRHSVTRPL